MMICISYISSAAILSRSSHGITKGSFYGFSSIAWRRGICRASFRVTSLDSILTRFPVQYFSTVRRAHASRSPKVKPKPTMEDASNAFYVVRKGDIVGIYKSLSDCQAQVSSLVCDPSVSVYKGYSLPKETEQYLTSRGLKNPLYSMHSDDVKEGLFGTLVPCPFQQPDGLAFLVDKSPKKVAAQKKSKQIMNNLEAVESSSFLAGQLNQFPISEDPIMAQPLNSKYMTCIIEFDGASKGNPGKAGAGAVLRSADGNMLSRVREGLGIVTNNVAEYRALILGMKYALKKGFQQIQVQGDSRLVCMQVRRNLYWTPCAAHCIDLMLKDIANDPHIKPLIRKSQDITCFIYNHGWALSIMRTETQNGELVRPAITRFVTNFIAFDSILKHQADLKRMINTRGWTDNYMRLNCKDREKADVVVSLIKSQTYWRDIAGVTAIFRPLVKVLRMVDSDDKAEMGHLYEAMVRAKEMIKKNVGQRYRKWWEMIDTRWNSQLHRDIHAAGYFLNPKYQYSNDVINDDEVLNGFHRVVNRMVNDNTTRLNINKEVQELWQTKHPNMADLCREAKQLKDRFLSFKISHVLREFNSDADAQANLAVNLPAGEVYEECGEFC